MPGLLGAPVTGPLEKVKEAEAAGRSARARCLVAPWLIGGLAEDRSGDASGRRLRGLADETVKVRESSRGLIGEGREPEAWSSPRRFHRRRVRPSGVEAEKERLAGSPEAGQRLELPCGGQQRVTERLLEAGPRDLAAFLAANVGGMQ
ncbi:hypothetical protein NDU88_006152 [Pleurodeles waltl]|uniref:Uncharacterized protein n=1 Tax=Pleurodeles waltl TaxID=8319 RepID=A0AAV7SNX6_PLEWA|nr:hypothetical protein NDU88_006152 [Pleurodeles waltl]